MNYLLVIAHADPTCSSSSHKLAEATKEVLEGAGKQVKVVDLFKDGFNLTAGPQDFVQKDESGRFSYGGQQIIPNNLSPKIIEQQELLKWCNYLLVFGPIWFYHYPACLYAWIERVFTNKFAYDFDIKREQLTLYGKKAMFIATTGAAIDTYTHGKGFTSLDGMLYTTTFGINGCGFTVYESQGVYSPAYSTPEQFQQMVELWKKCVLKIDKRPILPFRNVPEGKDEIQVFAEIKPMTLEEAANL